MRQILNRTFVIRLALAAVVVAVMGAAPAVAGASFGFAGGENAPYAVVSNSANPSQPTEANPNDLSTRAGAHPFEMTTSFKMNLDSNEKTTGEFYTKDISVNLPRGFSGSIVSVPQCPMADLAERPHGDPAIGCPTSSQVGVAEIFMAPFGGYFHLPFGLVPVYNMVPADGGTAELAFPVLAVVQPIIVTARTDGDYGLNSQTTNITTFVPFAGLRLTLWGVPADPRHDAERFLPSKGAACLTCFFREPGDEKGNPLPDSAPPTAYLTNPTKCGPADEFDVTFIGDSWSRPGRFNRFNRRPDLSDLNWQTYSTSMYPAGVTGCDKLRFNPSLNVTPDTSKADSPSGYGIDLHVPQSTAPHDLATPALKDAVATLPQGLAISPGAADGLQACTSDGSQPPGSPGNEIGLGTDAQPACPHASQVGTVTVTTPVLPEPLQGEVYLSSEHSGDKYAVFVVIRGEGLLVKLESSVVANPVTGQITATFANNPEFPFSDFVLHFYGGPRAVFVNPQRCGTATTTSDLTPWSASPGGTADATPWSAFQVSFDGLGAPCPSPQPFSPSFTAGTTSIQAGGYSPLTVTFSRKDEDQQVDHMQAKTPPGLLGTLANVPLCPEPQASQGTCSSASQIGHVVIGSGSGAAPLYLPILGQPQNPVYLTGPYKGAPFGLTFVVRAIAGPYDLGTVVVRAAVDVDPATAQLTVTSDPLPTILDGVPVQVKTVNVTIDRPRFIFNPTSCEPMSISGSMTSLQGSSASFSSPFQVTGCGDLKFRPQFKAFTSAHTSRANGASLDVRLRFPEGAFGSQANIAKVKVSLPRQLPSRLVTLQKACPAATFAANPGNCDPAAIVGVAKAKSPTLPGELTGPVYFVSHGGEKFPNLVVVLQGSGVRVDLTGTTFISKKGITSSTFESVPDVPVESFELYLPSGRHSALAANGDLCKSALRMPTSFVAHNGLMLHQSTPIAVSGCKRKAARRSHPAARRRHRQRHVGRHNGNGRSR